ncbi:hypothetical protein [Mediterranea sp. An20]|uniref:hypothetical protein n=1 Tax=Mediterranea sp. An20 TaxID=1965586 RepID=UPI001EF7161A|nr:hypothetical protein [Mediterranea sp. An20]
MKMNHIIVYTSAKEIEITMNCRLNWTVHSDSFYQRPTDITISQSPHHSLQIINNEQH